MFHPSLFKVNFLSPPFVLPIFYGFKESKNWIFNDSLQVSTSEITPLRLECNTRCCFIYLNVKFYIMGFIYFDHYDICRWTSLQFLSVTIIKRWSRGVRNKIKMVIQWTLKTLWCNKINDYIHLIKSIINNKK